MDKETFNSKMRQAIRELDLTMTTETFLLNVINREILWDLVKKIGLVEGE